VKRQKKDNGNGKKDRKRSDGKGEKWNRNKKQKEWLKLEGERRLNREIKRRRET
jgi:hypothetical protein